MQYQSQFLLNINLFIFYPVSRREAMFCLTGLMIGTVTGYYISINWKPAPRHVHHIKTIACHHYYGIEVCMIYLIIILNIWISSLIIVTGCVNDRRF